MDVKVYVTRALSEERKLNKDLDLLIHDFKRHKQGHRVSYFGKEVPYHRPVPAAEDAGLMHIHILDKVKTLKLGHSNTSDSVLIILRVLRASILTLYRFLGGWCSCAGEKARVYELVN